MTIAMGVIKEKDYNLLTNLGDEIDALESFFEYSDSTYICDAISEIADNLVPIYTINVWENVPNIREYIEEAIAQGLIDTRGDIDLIKIFRAGYYQYYSQVLYDNLDTLCFNYITNKVNKAIKELGIDKDLLDLDDIEYTIETETENSDNNDKFIDLDEKAKGIIDNIIYGKYKLED